MLSSESKRRSAADVCYIEYLLWTATRTRVEGDRRYRKKNRKAVQVRASNSIKLSTPGYGMTWREKI